MSQSTVFSECSAGTSDDGSGLCCGSCDDCRKGQQLIIGCTMMLTLMLSARERHRPEGASIPLAEWESGHHSSCQGLNQFQQQMYEQDQRIAEQRKANEQKQKELRDSILAASAARERTATASKSLGGYSPPSPWGGGGTPWRCRVSV